MDNDEGVATTEVVVELYMAVQTAPVVYDFFITRAGIIKYNRLATPMAGLIQVVMAGIQPSPRQELRVTRVFGRNGRYRILKFF